MKTEAKPHRQCSDCYYWLGHRCKLAEAGAIPGDSPATAGCAFFLRAALGFAFFPKL